MTPEQLIISLENENARLISTLEQVERLAEITEAYGVLNIVSNILNREVESA